MRAVIVRERKTVWNRMDALHVEVGLVNDDPGFTVEEYAERYRLSRPGAGHRLVALVRQGKLIAGWRHVNGSRVRTYRFPDEKH